MSLDEYVSSIWSGDYESPIKPPETADVVIIAVSYTHLTLPTNREV